MDTKLSASKLKMQELLAKLRSSEITQTNKEKYPLSFQAIPDLPLLSPKVEELKITDKYGNFISYNKKQQQFIDLVARGQSCVLIGAAGTGKTTCMKGAMLSIIQNGLAGILNSEDHKYLRNDTPGIAITAFTRRATSNIRKNVSIDLQDNCITVHKLLEYQPVYYDTIDPNTGDSKSKMIFEATRNQNHPLPNSLVLIACEESSMLSVDLYKELLKASQHELQWIFLGDIQQLPPVFGPAILGFKLLELPVIELTEVYRQALDSPIISLAHRILSGIPLPASEFKDWKFPKQLTIHPWAKKISPELALQTVSLFFTNAISAKEYDIEEDIILLPFNKAFGTDELNKNIANFLAKTAKRNVYEIVAGFNRVYYSVGDKVLYDKEDAIILKIEKNFAYNGVQPSIESPTLDYWGYDPVLHPQTEQEYNEAAMNFMLAASSENEERVRQCSHTIILWMKDSDVEIKINKAAEVNSLLLGYALTVHKAQGSEWKKVFFVCHQSHATMIQRELLYTAITRAREELYIICEPETFVKGILSQRVKGNSLEEKAEFFKGKLVDGFKLED